MRRHSLGVFNSDQVNRSGSYCPASELMKAEERHQIERMGIGLRLGLPTNIQHDMHRPIGWSHVLGHLIDGFMVRVIGLTSEAETDDEKSQLAALISQFWERHHDDGMEAYKDDLCARIKPATRSPSTKAHAKWSLVK